jgi:hypothetical protein
VQLGLLSMAALLALMPPAPAAAQQEWQPFKERDERAADKARRAARDAKPALPASADPATPAQPAVTAPAFTPPPKGTVERVELAPLAPPAEAAAPPSGPSPAPTLPGTAPLAPPVTAAVRGLQPAASPPGAGPADEAPEAGPAQRSALGVKLAAAPASDLPDDYWRGVDMAALEAAIQSIDVPPRSEALHRLWSRMMSAAVTPPTGARGPGHFPALQLEALYRSGLIDAMGARLQTAASGDPLTTAFRIRRDLAAADTDAACAGVKALAANRETMPRALRGEALILGGYCAAVGGNPAAAGLSADLAREEEVEAALALQALDAIAAPQGSPPPKIALPKRLMVLDYRLLALIGPVQPAALLASAEPALLYALSQTADTPAPLAVAAAEAAAGLNALDGAQLAAVYRRVAGEGVTTGGDPGVRRASQFAAVAAERQPQKRLTLARTLLDEARRAGLGWSMARALAVVVADVTPAPELGGTAAVAAELALVGGNYDLARRFAAAHPSAALWAPLAELADPALRGMSDAGLVVLDDAVRRGLFKGNDLHRLASVLDALDTNVPIPLWEAASRTPQPNTGHLPETGTLPQLQEASAKKDLGRTTLLVMRAIGTRGPDATHLIALGDSLRALRRVGFDGDARRLAFEALYGSWPRT